jgi:hypothetical protein
MNINKSTRHPKIAGDLGETLVLYWLSKYGFECAKVDHTGIDLIAHNPHTKQRMGISVKCRTRNPGSEKSFVRIDAKDFDKVKAACAVFDCLPYFAVVVDADTAIRVFITPMAHVLELFPCTPSGSGWRMSPAFLAKYANNREVMTFELEIKHGKWWQSAD